MKKKIICLASVCVPVLAAAQSNLQLFGILDLAVSHYSTAGGANVTKMVSGALQASRIGVRGTEDLGDGLAASFWIEADIGADSGVGGTTNTNNQSTGTAAPQAGGQGLTFNRRSTVSLSSNWGELRLGRDYVPTFWNFAAFDPFLMQGVASGSNFFFAGTTGPGLNTVRNSNTIGYLYNAAVPIGANGFYGHIQYALGENLSNTANADDGRYLGFRVGYAGGGWNAAFASSKTEILASRDFTTTSAGVSYNTPWALLSAQYTINKNGLPGNKFQTYLLGAQIPVGSGYIPVSFMKVRRDNATGATADQLAIGYVYNLSKRTALYTSYARINNKNGAAFVVGGSQPVPGLANAMSSGFDIGIRHTF